MTQETHTISTVETAKFIRQSLADFFSGVKFSVRAPRYGSIDISWTDGPTSASVDSVVKFFQCQTFDGMTESATYHNRFWRGNTVHFAANYVMTQRSLSNEFVLAFLPAVCKKYGQPIPTLTYYNDGELNARAWDSGPICGHDTLSDLVYKAARSTDARLMDNPVSAAKHLREIAAKVREELQAMNFEISGNVTARKVTAQDQKAINAKNLAALEDKLRAMADRWDAGTLHENLQRVNSRVLVEQLLRGHFPDAQENASDYKRLLAAGLGDPDTFRAARFELSLLGDDTAAHIPDAAQELRTLESRVALYPPVSFFPTPDELVKRMIQAANVREGMTVLEPSAGKGNIAKAIVDAGAQVEVIECNSDLRKILELKGFPLRSECFDFLEFKGEYDAVIMNPPFEHGQDIAHVMHAYTCLKAGGRLVAIMSESPFFQIHKKAVDFRAWLESVGGKSEKLDGAFKAGERKTAVATRLVIIDKPGQTSVTAPDPALMVFGQSGDTWIDLCCICQLTMTESDMVERDGKKMHTACAAKVDAYSEKVQRRYERLQNAANRAASEANALSNRAHDMAAVIPMGQPVLMDHYSAKRDMNYRAKIERTFERASQQYQRATRLSERASAARHNRAVSGDDPEALSKLSEKLAALEAHQADMVRINKVIRSILPAQRQTKAEKEARQKAYNEARRQPGVKALNDFLRAEDAQRKAAQTSYPTYAAQVAQTANISEAQALRLLTPDFAGRIGYADYMLSNNSSEIRRLSARIAELQTKVAQAVQEGNTEIAYTNEIRLIVNRDENRVQISFPGKPAESVRRSLRDNGFVWSPRGMVWQRQLNQHAQRIAQDLLTRLGESVIDETQAPTQESPIMETTTTSTEVTAPVAAPAPESAELAKLRAQIEHTFDLCEIALTKGIPILNDNGKRRVYQQVIQMANEAYGLHYAAVLVSGGNFIYPPLAERYKKYTSAGWSGLGLTSNL